MVPTPTTFSTPTGDEIPISIDPEYPEPPFVTSIDEIVPAADTIAVAAAPTPILPDEISASTSLMVIPYLSEAGK